MKMGVIIEGWEKNNPRKRGTLKLAAVGATTTCKPPKDGEEIKYEDHQVPNGWKRDTSSKFEY